MKGYILHGHPQGSCNGAGLGQVAVAQGSTHFLFCQQKEFERSLLPREADSGASGKEFGASLDHVSDYRSVGSSSCFSRTVPMTCPYSAVSTFNALQRWDGNTDAVDSIPVTICHCRRIDPVRPKPRVDICRNGGRELEMTVKTRYCTFSSSPDIPRSRKGSSPYPSGLGDLRVFVRTSSWQMFPAIETLRWRYLGSTLSPSVPPMLPACQWIFFSLRPPGSNQSVSAVSNMARETTPVLSPA